MKRHTVLLVDDEKVVREGCRRAFAAEGFQVLTAVNGQEALEVLTRQPVDVVLCDLKMPVMGALGVLEQVIEQYPEVPFIIITGQGTIANAVECIRRGAYDFVTKPFRVHDLVSVARRAIDKLPPLQRYQEPVG
jgi:two-component system, OmpR family, phosphate regulon sensor histidine kinase PhoR